MVWKAAAMFPHQKTLAVSGEALVTATVCFIASSSFGNYAYMIYMPLLAGCGEALRLIADVELQGSKVQANRAPAMPPLNPRSRFQLQK
jgi:hypothetical protein